ncbi:hypothetical protein EMIT0196P_130094 [Pseudomonas chlororaphis]
MGPAHEASADQAYSKFTHSRTFQNSYCKECSLWNKNSVIAIYRINFQWRALLLANPAGKSPRAPIKRVQ